MGGIPGFDIGTSSFERIIPFVAYGLYWNFSNVDYGIEKEGRN